MTGSGEVEGQKGFRERRILGVDMHAEHVEAHPQHVREIGKVVFFVVDADAIQKIGPRQQPTC